MPQHFETIVIGGGQAGLAVGYHLRRQQQPFVILDANDRIGDAWRKRWDSLRLFSPAGFNGLTGMPYPAPAHSFITKDEMADYLERYAAEFALPVRTGVRVDRLWRDGDRFCLSAGDLSFEADNVVIAMSDYQRPRRPEFASELSADITQLHSSEYRNPNQLQPGSVLIVGLGNSGAEIAVEVVHSHRTVVSGRDPGSVPFRMDGLPARLGLARLVFRGVFHRLLTLDTPIGRRAHAQSYKHTTPLVRVKPADLARAGVERVGRTVGVQDGSPLLEDGHALKVSNVIWCTGFHAGFSWIDLPIFDEHGPMHDRGVVTSQPGLYFVGLHFLYALSSSMVHGVSRDAERIARAIGGSAHATESAPVPRPQATSVATGR